MTPLLTKVETAIVRVQALPRMQHRSIFTEFTPDRIRAEALRQQARHDKGESLPLFGMLISVKDLFDEAGQVTGAGSKLLQGGPPATADAVAVSRLRNAGAVMFGRTSMSEFAYSGVGLNPHHGTPSSVLVEGVIPGGSSSGGAVGVALALTDAAIGTDTGGSLRIPAAANGIWGMKPSLGLIDDHGVHPLAPSYDTPGPMARDYETLKQVLEVMADKPLDTSIEAPLTLAVPRGAFTNDLTSEMAEWFAAEQARIKGLGHHLETVDASQIGAAIGLNRIIVSVEAYKIYAESLTRLESLGDPRVLARIRFAETLSQDQIADAYALRSELIQQFSVLMEGHDAMLAPTLVMVPPRISEVEADFDRLNAAMLRNPSLVNLVDGCAVSLPSALGSVGWSLTMLVGTNGSDPAILKAGRILERKIA